MKMDCAYYEEEVTQEVVEGRVAYSEFGSPYWRWAGIIIIIPQELQ